jgi:carbamoyltransferase
MYILGISAYFHDSAACLLKDDHIVAAVQEERFSRIKNDDQFPTLAIRYCLQEAGITLSQIDHIVFYEKPFLKFERLLESYLAFAPKGLISYLKAMPIWIRDKVFMKRNISKALQQIDPKWLSSGDRLLFTEHHQSHAASAFFPSPFEEAHILTIDGVGEWPTTSIWHGKGNQLDLIKEIKFPHSIGLLYAAFTYYLGFSVNSDEYKVMGLAPYGKPIFKDLILNHLVDLKIDGSFRLDMAYFNYCTGLTMTNNRFEMLFGQPVRKKDQQITQFHMDVAASIQKVTEEIILRIVSYMKDYLGADNICLAGGVALNCVINGKISAQYPFSGLWIQPAAGDAGGALGAAWYVYYHHLGSARKNSETDRMQSALLGPSYNTETVEAVLTTRGISYQKLNDSQFYSFVADQIDKGKVIGWFKGRMEFGPRALGARSIIADSRGLQIQSLINAKIKFRESFRPFAPAVLAEKAFDYFYLNQKSPYMLLVAQVRPVHLLHTKSIEAVGFDLLKQPRSNIPAVTHVDNSARIQTVSKTDNPEFHALIEAFYLKTGCPMIVNTSFNVSDEPIVCSPDDAINCFLKCDLDILAIENIIVDKRTLYTGKPI